MLSQAASRRRAAIKHELPAATNPFPTSTMIKPFPSVEALNAHLGTFDVEPRSLARAVSQ